MKKRKSKNNCRPGLQERQMKRLIIQPLAKAIRQEGAKCLKQGRRILKKLNEVDESVNIIARELARQLRKRGR